MEVIWKHIYSNKECLNILICLQMLLIICYLIYYVPIFPIKHLCKLYLYKSAGSYILLWLTFHYIKIFLDVSIWINKWYVFYFHSHVSADRSMMALKMYGKKNEWGWVIHTTKSFGPWQEGLWVTFGLTGKLNICFSFNSERLEMSLSYPWLSSWNRSLCRYLVLPGHIVSTC